nr:hypothetical protein [Candidatus Sigynarchaeum springense]
MSAAFHDPLYQSSRASQPDWPDPSMACGCVSGQLYFQLKC